MLAAEGEQVMIELYEVEQSHLHDCCQQCPGLSILTPTMLSLAVNEPEAIYKILQLLAQKSIKVKQINYAATNLESLFINLTSVEG